MSCKQPEDFQASYLGQEKGRIDVIALGSDYVPNKKQALQYKNVYFHKTNFQDNALALLAAWLETKKTYIFVNADQSQIDAVWHYLNACTSLDVRNGTLGYNGSGLTFYK